MFGAPTMYCYKSTNQNQNEENDQNEDVQMFFGCDRFHFMMPLFGLQWDCSELLGWYSRL